MTARVEDVNSRVLKECRSQVSIPLEEVEKKVPKIVDIEEGRIKPTFKQLTTLSWLYGVPRWVFIKNKIPEQYRFEATVPGFRQLKGAQVSFDPSTHSHVKRLMARVEGLRQLIVDLDNDMDREIPVFEVPWFDSNSPEKAAEALRRWYGVEQIHGLSFSEWKSILEKRGIFVFLTSKYPGWAHIDKTLFRGLTLFHETLPVIVINDSDAYKAQSFTLFHELGHLLRKESSVDDWNTSPAVEQWCDHFAGAFLMPKRFLSQRPADLHTLKQIAEGLQVSPYACLVRYRQLNLISQSFYRKLEQEINNEWQALQKKLKGNTGGPPRNRVKEIIHQYGYYSRTFFQAYEEKEINLHRLMSLLEFKKASYVFEAREML